MVAKAGRKRAQQKELEAEENAKNIPMSAFFKQLMHELEDEIEIQSQLDYHDGASIAKRLSETITFLSTSLKINILHQQAQLVFQKLTTIEIWESLCVYTHTKTLNKTHLTRQENWKSLLKLTQLESWSPNTMYKATNMFASSSKVARFYEIFLLPWAVFKPKGFFYGIIFPLCKSCTIPEDIMIGSIIQKFLFLKTFQGNKDCHHGMCVAEMEFIGTRRNICAGSSSNPCGRCSLLEIS
ncbi:hypothetical protein HID58_013622 [Brassica napus]|uniref:Uncharacterized protein n=1 Tax=Brassica napus TaxID=3708 RepID=A0ABQ8E759_BRANA|nr:hypothetical protein HID58_013622 [Brassica napus]